MAKQRCDKLDGKKWRLLIAAALSALAGCAVPRHPPSATLTGPASATTAPTTQADVNTTLALDQIEPRPVLAAATTQPSTRPSIDALVIYAQARDALTAGEKIRAVQLLEKAAALDPYSYAVRYDLGRAYLAVSNTDERAVVAFQAAAAIDPDQLDVHLQLGRWMLTRGQLDRGIQELRLARETHDYSTDDGQALVADFFLARALKEAGYDLAALQEYDAVLRRLQNPSLEIRQTPEMAYLVSRPEVVYVQMGELYEKHRQFDHAMEAYEAAARQDADNFELQSRVVRCLAALGRRDEAMRRVADLVVQERVSPQSLKLLSDTSRQFDGPQGAIAALRRLHEQHPDDHVILLALVQTLLDSQDLAGNAQAEALLAQAAQAGPIDLEITWKLFHLLLGRGAIEDAARLVLATQSRDPDLVGNVAAFWDDMLRPSQSNHLKLNSLINLEVPSADQAAKWFWVSRLAAMHHRDALDKNTLEKSMAARPVFVPAYRTAINRIWLTESSDEARIKASEDLAEAAAQTLTPGLADELRGLSYLAQKRPAEATEKFATAIAAGRNSAELQMEQASTRQGAFGGSGRYEQLLWKIISDYPRYEPAYRLLFEFYGQADSANSRQAAGQALKVLSQWRMSLPRSIPARLLEVRINLEFREAETAASMLRQLFVDNPDDADVLESLEQFHRQQGRMNELINLFEDYRSHHPADIAVVDKLASIYAEQKRSAEAIRTLDSTRQAVANDADLLYGLAQMYQRIGQRQTCEDVLQQVIHLDSNHAAASNDLGYFWADEGRNLAAAEGMIRVAVGSEPDNQSFLDSLGWVLYKRGKFAEAGEFLQQAVRYAPQPDPVVLDHLADTEYRLSHGDDARKLWQRSLKALGEGQGLRDDLAQLRLQLLQKIKQAEQGQPVLVAPTAPVAQAK